MSQSWQVQDQVLQSCTNEYHAKIDWRLEDWEEPILALRDYDPKNPPAEEELTDDELVKKREKIAASKKRIRRWLGYQQLMHEPCGDDTPLKKQVLNEYSKEKEKKPNLKWNMMYCSAAYEAVTAKLKFEKAMKEPVSAKLVDVQNCIDNLLTFVAPIITGIAEMTKLQCFFTAGRMIPKANGEISTKHYSVGSNPVTGIPFMRWKDNQFDKNVLEPFKEYLEGVYHELALDPREKKLT
ncbi:hypothetical protein C8J56DRAFT_1065424 [Mycena floridula]|nr:hypothetical protein C8J56DRAFT_1065424 [Mycena floridula]